MLTALIATVLFSVIAILFLKRFAHTFGLVAMPNARSSHYTPTPCGAGISFIGAFFFGVISLGSVFYSTYSYSFIAMFMVFGLGIYDDLKQTSSKLKFLVIIVASLFVLLDGLEISNIGVYAGYEVSLGYLAIPVTIFAVVGFTNALNLLDGLDGLAGLISLIILAGLGVLGYLHSDDLILNSSLLLIAALVVFLVFNWNPATIFMGDSGSLMLGFVIAVLSIKATQHIDPVSILYIAAIPILDTVTVMIRRKKNGRSIVSADRNHVHHILKDRFNGNVKLTVLIIAVMQLVFTLFGVVVTTHLSQLLTLPLFIACVIFFYYFVECLCDKTKSCTFE